VAKWHNFDGCLVFMVDAGRLYEAEFSFIHGTVLALTKSLLYANSKQSQAFLHWGTVHEAVESVNAVTCKKNSLIKAVFFFTKVMTAGHFYEF
jgi:hypothetical protein